MALFVPALRITMLFLNVYDAYKTLKPPAPSMREPTRPSVRAMTQRKRDMKGILAVWIIWCCFTAYERVVESLVSLFIPFYDEFKSMFMLFLILTRSRGAEPIFLHILRPIIKPYTSTLDGTLDLLRMVGDFVFALSAFPVHLAFAWWDKRSKPTLEESDSDSETGSQEADSIAGGAHVSSDHSSQRASLRSTHAAQHEIWVPPSSAYESDNEELNEAVDAPPEILDLTREERAVEEWRKYPAFPSAYPATPVVTHSQLSSTFPNHGYPPIFQHQPEQGFHRSLLSSRSPLNPSYANDSSDHKQPLSGIYHVASTAEASSTAVQTETEDDSISGGDSMDETEDIFNMTLRTPLPPHGGARSRMMSKITIPGPLASAMSQSTAITSAHTSASLRTRTWSESSRSASPSPAKSSSSAAAADLEQTIGRNTTRSRVQQMEQIESEESSTHKPTRPVRRQRSVRKRKVSRSDLQELTATSDVGDDDESEAPSALSGDDKREEVYVSGEKRPEVKRRKLASTPRKVSTSNTTKAIQPLRATRRPLSSRQVPQAKSGQIGLGAPHTFGAAASVAVRKVSRPHARSSGSSKSDLAGRGGRFKVPSSTGSGGALASASSTTDSSTTSSLGNKPPIRRSAGATGEKAALPKDP